MDVTGENQANGQDNLKGLSPVDIIIPKLPLIDPLTGKRQDGRAPNQLRQFYLENRVQSKSHAGSAYLEFGSTKVLCVIDGPKDVSKKIDFCSTGIIFVNIVSVGSKVSERMIFMVKEALESVILLDKFPKSLLEINLDIIEDGGSALSTCITTAGLALIDANVPLFDIPIGGTVLCHGNDFYLDPTTTEIESLDLTNQRRNDIKGGIITVGYLPSKNQHILCTMEGKMQSESFAEGMGQVKNLCVKIFALVRKFSTKNLDNICQDEATCNDSMTE